VKNTTIRFVLALLLLVSAAALLWAQRRGEIFPPRTSLAKFPLQIDQWSGTDVKIDPKQLEVLGPGDFLQRIYRSPDPSTPDVELFIAYFPSQRSGDTIHSPKNCLPGSGWTPVQSQRVTIAVPEHAPFPANRYVVVKGDARRLLLYWYWAHDRGVASEYWAKYYLVADSIRMHRSDGALVRVIMLADAHESAARVEQRLTPFVSALVPQLNTYIPR
jgi:EpsI family protein